MVRKVKLVATAVWLKLCQCDEHKINKWIRSSPSPLLLSQSYFGVIPHIRIEYSGNGRNKVAMLNATSPQLKNFNWWSLGTAILCHCPPLCNIVTLTLGFWKCLPILLGHTEKHAAKGPVRTLNTLPPVFNFNYSIFILIASYYNSVYSFYVFMYYFYTS